MAGELLIWELQCVDYQNAKIPTNIKAMPSQTCVFGEKKKKKTPKIPSLLSLAESFFFAKESPGSTLG